jgi:type VI secretion system protein ImpM
MSGLSAGFFGKIPSRGDFVRHGLPPATVAALDSWCEHVLPGSRAILGEEWTPAWMEAPIWRFRLPPDRCGPVALAGLWLPSTDRAGRLFPLILAVTGPGLDQCADLLDQAEAIGIGAIERDVTPEQLATALAAAPSGTAPLDYAADEWWTAGSTRVAPARRRFTAMPDATAFAAMLSDHNSGQAAAFR